MDIRNDNSVDLVIRILYFNKMGGGVGVKSRRGMRMGESRGDNFTVLPTYEIKTQVLIPITP